MRRIQVVDYNTGETLLHQEFDGDFQVQLTDKRNSDSIIRRGRIDNGRFDGKHLIKNYFYRPIAEQLVKKFDELHHIRPGYILFLENDDWKPNGAGKKTWIARISKANSMLRATWGYAFVIELKRWYIDKMSKEQIIATVYHELLHIDTDLDLRSHDIEDWDVMVATLGKNWAETKSRIANLLDEEFPGWLELRKVGNQITLDDYNVVPINRASKTVNME